MKSAPVIVKGWAAPVATGCAGLTEEIVGVTVGGTTVKLNHEDEVAPLLTRTRHE